ncbi:MAG: hypothetical protein V3V76_09995 [Candidatus Adiutricales bacterium]
MDNIDRLNDTVNNLIVDWRNIFVLVAVIFLLSTLIAIWVDNNKALLVLSWVIVAVAAAAIFYYPRKSEKEEAS